MGCLQDEKDVMYGCESDVENYRHLCHCREALCNRLNVTTEERHFSLENVIQSIRQLKAHVEEKIGRVD